jgi:hypothetical protein
VAEDYTYAPGAVGTGSSGDLTIMAEPMDGIFSCSVPWANVQAAPSGFVVGNCKSGTHLHRQMKSSKYDNTYWDGGYVYGNYAGCGWIEVSKSQLLTGGGQKLCDPNSIGYNLWQYANYTNDATSPKWPNCSDNQATTKCTDGTSVTSTGACSAYRNFRPWASGQAVTDPVGTYPIGKVFKWRYTTRYGATNFSNMQFVMVRDPSISPGQGNWMFINRNCLPSVLPGAQAV